MRRACQATLEQADVHEKQADQFTPNNSLYHWVLARRLQDLGMTDLAEKHFQQAKQLDSGGELPADALSRLNR